MLRTLLFTLVFTICMAPLCAPEAQQAPATPDSPPTATLPAEAPGSDAAAERPHPPAAIAEQPLPPTAAAEPVPAARASERLELDSTAITGNRELPRVLYIVPWKKSGLGELAERPTNSLLDEVMAPVDREVFRRQNQYFDALSGQQADSSATDTKSSNSER